MKKLSILSAAGCAALSLVLIAPAGAQVAVQQQTTTSTRSAGTLTTFDPTAGTVVLSPEGATAPTSYRYSKETRVVDATGATVSVETIKPGVPVEVYYTPGDVRTIERIVVQEPVAATTTTTTTAAPVVPAVVKEEISTTTTTTTTED